MSERVLNFRSEVLSSCEGCRRHGPHRLIRELDDGFQGTMGDYAMKFSILRHIWAIGKKEHAILEVEPCAQWLLLRDVII